MSSHDLILNHADSMGTLFPAGSRNLVTRYRKGQLSFLCSRFLRRAYNCWKSFLPRSVAAPLGPLVCTMSSGHCWAFSVLRWWCTSCLYSLQSNVIKDDGARCMAEALASNQTLSMLQWVEIILSHPFSPIEPLPVSCKKEYRMILRLCDPLNSSLESMVPSAFPEEILKLKLPAIQKILSTDVGKEYHSLLLNKH